MLHLTGNLNYYIGAEIGKTGYVRDRDLEFAEPKQVPKAEALAKFRDAVAPSVRTALKAQSSNDWAKLYTAVREETQEIASPSSCGAPRTCTFTWDK